MSLFDAKKCPCYTCKTQCSENPMRCSSFRLWLQKQFRGVEAVVAELKENQDRALAEYEKTCATGGYEHDFADGESEAYEHAIEIVRGKE